jgi:hypothetical protein
MQEILIGDCLFFLIGDLAIDDWRLRVSIAATDGAENVQ